jgi:hypothetical protein
MAEPIPEYQRPAVIQGLSPRGTCTWTTPTIVTKTGHEVSRGGDGNRSIR